MSDVALAAGRRTDAEGTLTGVEEGLGLLAAGDTSAEVPDAPEERMSIPECPAGITGAFSAPAGGSPWPSRA
ncbi:MAG: hypothetical protein ABI537_15265 [Casimicrobiaceae bacterium]